MHYFKRYALACLVLLPALSHAQFVNRFQPLIPFPNQPTSLIYHVNPCEPNIENVNGILFEVRQDASNIDIFISVEPQVCGVPPGTLPTEYPLGQYDEGQYQVNVYTVLSSESYPVDSTGLTPDYTATLVVGPAPAAVPVMNSLGLFVLFVMMTILASWILRRRPLEN